jgi:hypothetical protein
MRRLKPASGLLKPVKEKEEESDGNTFTCPSLCESLTPKRLTQDQQHLRLQA